MCASWNEKYNPEAIANGLEAIKHFDEKGEFSGFSLFESQDYFAVLESSLSFNPEIGEAARRRLIYTGVHSEAKKGILTVDGIRKAVSNKESLYLSTPKRGYVLVTPISLNYSSELTNRTLKGSKLVFSPSLSRRFETGPLDKLRNRLGLPEIPDKYTYVRISVKSRDDSEAVTLALDVIDLVRGIWNLLLNETAVLTFGSRRREPINKIRLGPYHTLHTPRGKLAREDIVWYEPDYVERPFDVGKRWSGLKKAEKDVYNKLRNHQYKGEIEDALRRYVRALDYKDPHLAFIQLWGVLEKLAATTKAEYDTTIKRAVFLFADSEFHKQVLQHLRVFRNSNVHAGTRTEQIEIYLYQLKRYVEQFFFFHLANRFKFKTSGDAARFLDHTTDLESLRKRVKLAKDAILFRTS
jgi:hypothetical protein